MVKNCKVLFISFVEIMKEPNCIVFEVKSIKLVLGKTKGSFWSTFQNYNTTILRENWEVEKTKNWDVMSP